MSNYFKSKNILVTGGAGFVGVNLIKRLLLLGANVTATRYKKPSVIKDKRIRYIKCDLQKSDDCNYVVKDMDYIFLCAAVTSGAEAIERKPLFLLTPNLLMSVQMLEAAYAANIKKVLFISSNTVYPLTNFAVKENDVNNEYFDKYFIAGSMKRFCETVCEIYSTKILNPMKTVVVRPGNLYGPNDKFDWEKSKVIPALIRRAVERHDPFVVWGDGMDLKDFLYVDDYIDGMLLAMEKLDEFQPINIANGLAVTIREVLKEILSAADYQDAPVEYDASKPTMIPKRMIDISLAKKILGWQPKVSLQEGIKKTVDWYKKTYKYKTPEDLK